MRFRVILNRDGGTLRTMDLDIFVAGAEKIFAQEGHDLDSRVVAGSSVERELLAAALDPAVDVLIAAGGDGTISTAARVAFEHDKALGVLPAGTMNLFARAIGMPLDLPGALTAIATGEVHRIDIATANGKPFVHQFGIGIHARLVRIRDGMVYRGRLGKMAASLRSIMAAAVDPPRFEVELDSAAGQVEHMASGIAISNNPLDNAPVPVAARLDSGLLGVYVAQSVTTNELFNLGLDVITGRWRTNPRISEYEVPKLTLRFPKRKRGNHAVVDGELISLDPIVVFEMHSGGLPIMLPKR